MTLKNNSTFSLKDGERIVIQGLPIRCSYSVEENDYTSVEGYTTTVNDVESNRYEGVVEETDYSLEFKNTLDADSILGVDTQQNHSVRIVFVIGMFLTIYLLLFAKKHRIRELAKVSNNISKRQGNR